VTVRVSVAGSVTLAWGAEFLVVCFFFSQLRKSSKLVHHYEGPDADRQKRDAFFSAARDPCRAPERDTASLPAPKVTRKDPATIPL